MVKTLIRYLHKEINSLHEAAYLLAFFAMFSQILALLRDRLLSHHFGAGLELDMYYAAFRIPDFIFISAGSLVSISVLVPFFIDRLGKDEDGAKVFISELFSLFSLFILIIAGIAFVTVPYLVPVIFPGFTDPLVVQDLVSFTRLLLLSPILLGISNFLASITQVHKKFAPYALSPVLYNLGIIIGIVLFAGKYGIRGVIYGVIIGASLHLLIQVPTLIKDGLMPRYRRIKDWVALLVVVKLSIPRTLALSTSHIVLFFMIAAASLMTEGSISVFNLSFNLQSVPLSIVGVSYSIAAFPTLARLFADGKVNEFISEIGTAIRHIIFWSLPISVLFIVLRAQIVRTAFGSGNFSWSDTKLVAASLALFSISIVAQTLVLLFVRVFYAAGKTRLPLLINASSALFTVALGYVVWKYFMTTAWFSKHLISILRLDGVQGSEVIVLAFVFSVGSIFNLFVFWFFFRKMFGKVRIGIAITLLQSIVGSLFIGVVAYYSLFMFAKAFNTDTLLGIFSQGFLAGIMGIFAGIVVLLFIDNREIRDVWKSLSAKIWKAQPVLPESSL